MAKAIKNIPLAQNLMGSMRSMGYNFESAVADVVDNSISAGCSNVRICFPSDPLNIFVGILDNGKGLSREDLFKAMRYGSESSLSVRNLDDLGRFGLGLKSASLSQCKKLTVVSKQGDSISAFCWDFDYIAEKKDWLVLELNRAEMMELPCYEFISNLKNGTLVLWQDFDIIEKSSNGQVYATLKEHRAKLEKYLGLIFHRFISRSNNPVRFVIDNSRVPAADPFLEHHKKTTIMKEVDLAVMDSNGNERHVKVTPVVLPFQSELTDKDIVKLGGIENMRTKQGFYIYRNYRLILWGTWFGLPRNELTKNARIRVDIPNALDDIFGIDITKQNASIPKVLQIQLRKKVEEVMNISVRQETHRGRKEDDDEIEHVWNRMNGRDNHVYWEINRESQLFNFVKSRVPEEAYPYIEMLVKEIEGNLPYQQLYIDHCNKAIETSDRTDEIVKNAFMLIDFAKSSGVDVRQYIDSVILKSEPYTDYPNLKETLYTHYGL